MSGILVIAEHLRGGVNPQSLEVAGFARALKDGVRGPLRVAVIAHDPASFYPALALEGVDEVIAVSVPEAHHDHFDAMLYEEAAVQLAMQLQPRLLLVAHTVNAMGYAPGAAVRLGGSFVADALAIDTGNTGNTGDATHATHATNAGDATHVRNASDTTNVTNATNTRSSGSMIITRGGYANRVQVRLDVSGHCITTVTVRGGSAKAPQPSSAEIPLREINADFSAIASNLARHDEYIDPPPADIDIAKAEFVLSVGRGIQDEKHIERFRALAARLGATLGCSRPVADSGWLPKAHQVGLSGKVATSCKLYLALGISGAVQHLHGMKHVDTIIAVNTDRNAPIYTVATCGVAADLFEFADALEKAWG